MKTPLLTRRSALALAAAGFAAAALPSWLGPPVRCGLARRLVAVFRHPESARAVGRLYLARRPQEGEPDRLVALIARDLEIAPWPVPGRSLPDLRARIRRRALAERQSQRTLAISGYEMSLTELRLCALAWLSA